MFMWAYYCIIPFYASKFAKFSHVAHHFLVMRSSACLALANTRWIQKIYQIWFCVGRLVYILIVFPHVQIDRTGQIPLLRFRDRESYAGNKTKEYDDIAMKYLSYLLFFLVACSAVYSLKYERHKSWYSWILSSLTSCVYMFGRFTLSLPPPLPCYFNELVPTTLKSLFIKMHLELLEPCSNQEFFRNPHLCC